MNNFPYVLQKFIGVFPVGFLLCLCGSSCRQSLADQPIQPRDTLAADQVVMKPRIDSTLLPWAGSYGYEREDGRDPVGAQIFITYRIDIGQDSSFYGGMGYQTYFRLWVQPDVDGDTLRLKLRALLDGDTYHEPHDEVGKLYHKGHQYWFHRAPYQSGDALQMEFSEY
jgi:Family of unknown function (DUF5991)